MNAARSSLLIVATALTGACTDPTQLLVVVDTDFAVPSELSSAAITVRDQSGVPLAAQRFEFATEGRPFSFSVEAKGALIDETVDIHVEGRDLGGNPIVEQRAVVGFVREEQRQLLMFLWRACAGRVCVDDQTCRVGRCEGAEIDALSLPVVDPEREFDFDAGFATPDDAGPSLDAADAGPQDGPVMDASPMDASPPDGGPPSCFTTGCGLGMQCIDQGGGVCPDEMTTCFCVEACDPYVPGIRCTNVGQICFWNDPEDLTSGICIEPQGGTGRSGDPCTVQEDCDVFDNFRCVNVGSTEAACVSFCRVTELTFCPSIETNSVCRAELGDLGFCKMPRPMYEDVGDACVDATECESGICLMGLNFCTASCDGLNDCPSGSECGIVGGLSRCIRACPTGDCGGNMDVVCRSDLGDLCWPSCEVTGCAQGMCDLGTGSCI